MTGICEAATPDQLCEVRKLMRAFIEWHRERHHDQVDLIDRYFDPVGFEAELGSLPGKYAPPKGRLLLALHEGRPAGCIALRDLGGDACEMKRMFVDPEFHGKGVGRDLVKAIVQSAKDIGFAIMRLDTGSKQIEAQTLYRRMGFRIVPPYYELPADLRN